MADTFFQELAAFESETMLAIQQEVINFARMVLDAVIRGNIRVLDTGRSTASWVISADSPSVYVALDVTPLNSLSPSSARERSLNSLANLSVYRIGADLFITNGNDYIFEIEFEGKSTRKAPEGFVRLALSDFPDIDYTILRV